MPSEPEALEEVIGESNLKAGISPYRGGQGLSYGVVSLHEGSGEATRYPTRTDLPYGFLSRARRHFTLSLVFLSLSFGL